jgi:uncharacterized membrane protein YbhN (UPF0104 family)
MESRIKQKIVYVSQICIGLVLVTWILLQIDKEQFLQYFKNLSFVTLVTILILSGIGLYIQFRRWKYLVERYSLHFNLGDLLPSFFAGYAFRLLIPGGHAEFSKIFLLPGKKRGKVLAFGMEKFAQALIKILALLFVLPITFPELKIYSIFILLLLIIGYFLFPKIPILKNLQEKDVNYHRVIGMNLVFAFGVFIIMGLQYYLLLNQVDKISLIATYHTSVYLWSAGMVPISVSGLGVREGLAVYFFNFYGVSAAHAVATSLFLFTINTIFPALVGAIYIYRNRACFGDLKDSIKSTREILASIRSNKRGD